MQIHLNGQIFCLAKAKLAKPVSVVDLLGALDLVGKRLAVEVNEQIIPKSRHAATFLQANDRVEIVHAIGGG